MSDIAYDNLRQQRGGDELPDYIDKPLTDEEKQAVLNQGNHGVSDPVPQHQFQNLEEFKQHQNNFYVHFADINPKSFLVLYRVRRSYQRFELLYPELNQRLLSYKIGQFGHWPDQAWDDLLDAYKKMSSLVDRKDAGIVGQIEDGVSEQGLGYYLCA